MIERPDEWRPAIAAVPSAAVIVATEEGVSVVWPDQLGRRGRGIVQLDERSRLEVETVRGKASRLTVAVDGRRLELLASGPVPAWMAGRAGAG